MHTIEAKPETLNWAQLTLLIDLMIYFLGWRLFVNARVLGGIENSES